MKRKNIDDGGGYKNVTVSTPSGSLLVMKNCTQLDWLHSVPKDESITETRINLTYRLVYPLEEMVAKTMVISDDSSLTIETSGNYIVSETSNGKSELVVDNEFFTNEEKLLFFTTLRDELDWQTKMNKKYGVLEPRKTAWFGEVPYHYSGIVEPINNDWHSILTTIKSRLCDKYQYTFNSVLCNIYEDGKSHIAWHADDEIQFGDKPTIASISLGKSRDFLMKRKNIDADDRGYKNVTVSTPSGSLLVMKNCTQLDWLHSVPKDESITQTRINLTYRLIYPLEECQQND